MLDATPMLKQFQVIKEQYKDCLLFYRMGDFYEMFGDDALIASRELEIVLTAKAAGKDVKLPMCGVPYHAVDGYLAKLIAKGYKVAICEQIEDPKLAKGIVKRDVIRVVTPGTLVESQLLNEDANNYLMAVWPNADLVKEDYSKNAEPCFGLAYVDISTGKFLATEIKGVEVWNKLADEICRIAPAECILPEYLYASEFFNIRMRGNGISTLTKVKGENFIKNNMTELLMTHFKTASLEGLGFNEMPVAAYAVAAILYFLQDTQKRSLSYLNQVQTYNTNQHMVLDATTRRNLEITSTMRTNQRNGSLLSVCDDIKTAMGARLLKEWLEKPLLSTPIIRQRLDGVEELFKNPFVLEDLRGFLKDIYDLQRLVGRISYGNAGPKDMIALKNSCFVLPSIFQLLVKLRSSIFRAFLDHFDILDDLATLIDESMADDPPLSARDGDVIKSGYNAQIDELRQISHGGKDFLLRLEAKERERTGIKSLKIGFNKVFGYYIEITNSNLSNVPQNYIRKQTLVNGERYITEELKEWESKILTASEHMVNLEYDLFCQIRGKLAQEASRIQRTADVIAHLDALQSLASVALKNGYIKPIVDDSAIIEIREGRHPVVERNLGRENYVPNDAYLDTDTQQFMLITGPNMTGKSTYMRQVALIVLLARVGSFVPAVRCRVGKIDRIFTRVGASDDLAAGQSTFMVEMCETSNILRHATKDSLIILDEIGRGTSTLDGLSIAWAVTEYIMQPECRAKTLFATHYHELLQLEENYPTLKNYSIAVKEKDGQIVFLHKIVPGGTDKSYGIQVASLAGLPDEVIVRAKEILIQLEGDDRINPSMIEPYSQQVIEAFITQSKNGKPNPLLAEIRALNVNDITPIQALYKIEQWQKKLNED